MVFKIKQGDTAPAIEAQLLDPDNEPAPLELAQEIEFHFIDSEGDQLIEDDLSGNVAIVDESEAIVQYRWQEGDTDYPGQKQSEFIVTFENGDVQSYPNGDYLYVQVIPDVDSLE